MTGRPPSTHRARCATCGRPDVAHRDGKAWNTHLCPHGNACRAKFGTTVSKSCDACALGARTRRAA